MRALTRTIAGEAGLASAFAFLVTGAVVVSLAFSAGLFLAAKGDGASTTSITLLLGTPLFVGVIHSLVSAFALWRASASKSPSVRALTLAVAGFYCLLQVAAFVGGLLLASEFGL